MGEYISREAIVKEIKEEIKACDVKFVEDIQIKKGLKIALKDIKVAKAADVQSVNQWISVDKALPIYDGLVLAVDKNNTIRLGMYTDLGWTSQFGNPMVAHITHWMPLPEPPQD